MLSARFKVKKSVRETQATVAYPPSPRWVRLSYKQTYSYQYTRRVETFLSSSESIGPQLEDIINFTHPAMPGQGYQASENQQQQSTRQQESQRQTQSQTPPQRFPSQNPNEVSINELVRASWDTATEVGHARALPPPPPYAPGPQPYNEITLSINMNNNNIPPSRQGSEEAQSSDTEQEDTTNNNTFRLDVNSEIRIRGHGSIIGVAPVNAAEVTTEVARMLGQQGPMNQQQDASGRRQRRFNININSGVIVQGDRNIVGPGLGDIARMGIASRGAPNGPPPSARQIIGNANHPGANVRLSSAGMPNIVIQQGLQRSGNPMSANANGNGNGNGNTGGGGAQQRRPLEELNKDLYKDPPKPKPGPSK